MHLIERVAPRTAHRIDSASATYPRDTNLRFPEYNPTRKISATDFRSRRYAQAVWRHKNAVIHRKTLRAARLLPRGTCCHSFIHDDVTRKILQQLDA